MLRRGPPVVGWLDKGTSRFWEVGKIVSAHCEGGNGRA